MQNVPFPFNQKQHIFDFKVKVNFQNGNVSLTAPQIVNPPAYFNHQASHNQQNIQQVRNGIPYNSNQPSNHVQNKPVQQNFINVSTPFMASINNPQPLHSNYPIGKDQQIQLVNSSYTSLRNDQSQLSNINNSMQIIECVICQKSFNANQLQHHLQLHRNKSNKNNISTQKGNISNYAMTQNSVNAINDSALSDQKSNSSFHNQSYQSQQNSFNNSFQKTNYLNNKSSSSFVTSHVNNMNGMNLITRRNQVQKSQNTLNNNNVQQSNQQNDSFPLLGRIQNPILAIKNQQSSLSQSLSSHPNQSLNYSNSESQQSTTRFNNLIVSNPNDQSPQFHNPNSSNSSFGNLPGSNMIGPSFYHNSSHQSGNPQNKGPTYKGINRLVYNDSIGSLQSQVPPLITNPMPLVQNQSYHSNHSHNSSYGSQHSNQFIQAQMNFNNGSQQFSQQSNNFSNQRNSVQSNHSSFGSNGNSYGNMPLSNSNPIFHNFQTTQSRYLNQPGSNSNSRQLYGSYQEINNGYQSKNRMRNEDVPFSESDISSISYESRADMSQYSDWTDFKHKSQPKLQGYNSADNSLIKNMQYQESKQQRNNLCIMRRNKNENEKGQQTNFFKKKKDHMISSAASYYEKKFKDEESSSSDEDNLYKTSRLSYAERLKEKRLSDMKSMEMSQAKSGNKLKLSQRSNNLSKYSDDSNMSKTKLPVNYLARQEFISTSSTSKSTHKTAVPN